MTLMYMLFLYDNRMGTVVINDNNGNELTRGTASELYDKLSQDMLVSEVIAYGFYDGELCLRISY